jgi:hypothetical protein
MADNSGVGVGGDGSVEWRVRTHSFREKSTYSERTRSGGYEQGGISETEDGQSFTVNIKIPRIGGRDLATGLEAAARAALAGAPGEVVTFTLPIESQNPNQVLVGWESKAPSKGTPPRKKPRKAAAKAKPAAKSAKKAAKKPGKKKAGKKR